MGCGFLPIKIIYIKHFIFLIVIVLSDVTHFICAHTEHSSLSRNWGSLLKFVKVGQHVILKLGKLGHQDVSTGKGDSFKD